MIFPAGNTGMEEVTIWVDLAFQDSPQFMIQLFWGLNIGHLDCKQAFFVPLFNDVRPSFLEILAYLIPIPTVKQAIVEETKIAV